MLKIVRNKVIAIITCGVLVTAGITSSNLISQKHNNEKIIENQVLLANQNLNNLAVVVNTNVDPLVLYSSPNSNSNVESYISVGEMLNYTATSNPNFYKVTVQETGATGYIDKNNMQIVQSGLNKAYEDTNASGEVINVTYNVKLMSSPDVHSQILGSYKNDTKMKILGEQGQWYKVSINGQVGYMYQEYVGIDKNSVTTSNSTTTSTNVTTISNSSTTSNNTNTNSTNTPSSYPVTVETINSAGQKVGFISTFRANSGSSYTPTPENVSGEHVSSMLVNGVKSNSSTVKIDGPTNIVFKLSNDTTTNSNNNISSYYGTWIPTKIIGYQPVSTGITLNQIKSNLIINNQEISFNGNTEPSNKASVIQVSLSDFANNTGGATLKDIGITTNSANALNTTVAGDIFKLSNNTLIVDISGAFVQFTLK